MTRIKSVDFFRLIALISVICIHTTPFKKDFITSDEIWKYIPVAINQIARFAVPFFFVISGYFWGLKIRRGENPIFVSNGSSKKLIYVFLIWSLIYLIPHSPDGIIEYGILGPLNNAYWNLSDLLSNPIRLMMEGTKVHLWFLIALLFSLNISAIFLSRNWEKALILLSICLYIFGLLAKAYSATPFGFEMDFNTRNGPFFGTALFVTGYIISNYKPTIEWVKYGTLIFMFGLVLHFSELYYLWKYYNTSLYQDYVIGTYFMGLGVSLIALSNNDFLKLESLSSMGKYSLGIYSIHFIFIDMFKFIERHLYTPIWEIGYVATVFILSFLTIKYLSKFKYLKKIMV